MATEEIVSRETSPAPIEEYAGESWETMLTQAAEVFGADLEKGRTLIGVPFMGIKITVRPGEIKNAVTKKNHPYASLDLIVAPERELARGVKRGRIAEPVMVDPGEHLVINVAGTGAYRQLVQTLEATGAVTLPEGDDGGKFGESRFDSLASTWTLNPASTAAITPGKDGGEPTIAFDIRLYCPRGLRASEYENEYTKEGETLYIG